MNDEIFDKIKLFVTEKRGKYRKKLTSETQLERDLKITGDDFVEFMDDFEERFNVNTQNLDLSEYFVNEGTLQLLLVILGIPTGKKVITLGDLQQGVLEGKLDDTVIGQK